MIKASHTNKYLPIIIFLLSISLLIAIDVNASTLIKFKPSWKIGQTWVVEKIGASVPWGSHDAIATFTFKKNSSYHFFKIEDIVDHGGEPCYRIYIEPVKFDGANIIKFKNDRSRHQYYYFLFVSTIDFTTKNVQRFSRNTGKLEHSWRPEPSSEINGVSIGLPYFFNEDSEMQKVTYIKKSADAKDIDILKVQFTGSACSTEYWMEGLPWWTGAVQRFGHYMGKTSKKDCGLNDFRISRLVRMNGNRFHPIFQVEDLHGFNRDLDSKPPELNRVQDILAADPYEALEVLAYYENDIYPTFRMIAYEVACRIAKSTNDPIIRNKIVESLIKGMGDSELLVWDFAYTQLLKFKAEDFSEAAIAELHKLLTMEDRQKEAVEIAGIVHMQTELKR